MTDAEKQATCEAQTALLQKVRDFCEMHHRPGRLRRTRRRLRPGPRPGRTGPRFLKRQTRTHTEVVLTGRDPSPALLDLADYVSEIKKIKHPFDRGIAARIGIEE